MRKDTRNRDPNISVEPIVTCKKRISSPWYINWKERSPFYVREEGN